MATNSSLARSFLQFCLKLAFVLGISVAVTLVAFLAVLVFLALIQGGSLFIRNLALAIAVSSFLSILALGRWLLTNGAQRTGFGCIGSTFVALIGLATACLFPRAWYPLGISGVGIVGWLICFGTFIPFMAEREKHDSHPKGYDVGLDGNNEPGHKG